MTVATMTLSVGVENDEAALPKESGGVRESELRSCRGRGWSW